MLHLPTYKGDPTDKEKIFDSFPRDEALEAWDFEVKLADFGVAKILLPNQMTQTNAGTPIAQDPDCLEGKEYGSKADLFSLGVMFFHLLTGDYPFVAGTP